MTLNEQFNRDGYLIIDNFYTGAQCDELMRRGEELSNNFNFIILFSHSIIVHILNLTDFVIIYTNFINLHSRSFIVN